MSVKKQTIEGFKKAATASVADAVEQICGKRGFLGSGIRPRINNKRIVGPAATILEGPSDEFLPPQHALDLIDEAEEGSVIVISTNGYDDVAVWGGLMTAGAVANNHAGAILDAGVRDIEEIRRDYDFPIMARSVLAGTTLGRFKTLDSNVPVAIDGIIIHPGDIIVADIDGVVVVPMDKADEILKLAQEIDVKELEQAKLIIKEKSLREGLAKYGRI